MIDSFKDEYDFLSNFYPICVWMDGYWYPSVEHAYQAAKTLSPGLRRKVKIQRTPGMAKHVGKWLKLRKDWEDIKLQVMVSLVTEKFIMNKELGDKLLATGDEELVEGNWWGDIFWGVCKGEGENNLGKLLMKIRQVLKENKS